MPRLWLARPRPHRRRDAAARARARRALPELTPIRLDADATAGPGALAAALARFAETDLAVLVGTQMVAKGHHFAGVAVAAVVDADTGLALPDFRAEERTFQLLTQLAGRSGRDAPGRVLVQTFQPDSRAIVHAARHDAEGFLADELERRRELGYPPFRHLVRVVAAGPEPDGPLRLLQELRGDLEGRTPSCSVRRRSSACAAATARSWSPRPSVRGRSPRGPPAARAAPRLAMRRDGLAAVVDVDPQGAMLDSAARGRRSGTGRGQELDPRRRRGGASPSRASASSATRRSASRRARSRSSTRSCTGSRSA